MPIAITAADLRALLNESNNEDPALYVKVDEDNGTPTALDVWAQALAPSGSVVITKADLLDAVGDDPEGEELDTLLPDLQDAVDTICDTYAPVE